MAGLVSPFVNLRDLCFVGIRQERSQRRHTDFASTLCPPTLSRIDCFNMLTNIWLTLSNDRFAIPRRHNKRSLADLPACPPGVAAAWCYEEDATATDKKKNKIEWTPCPGTGNKLGCFEQYMHMYMLATDPREPSGQRRRRRRAALLRPTGSAQTFCHPGEDTLQCYTTMLKMYVQQVSRQQQAAAHKRSVNVTAVSREGVATKRALSSIAQMCAPSTDSLACFEHYLALYLRLSKDGGGEKKFIGRDLVNIDSRME